MNTLASFCREIYYGSTKRALRTRYAFLLFDLVVISYFVVTTFLPPYDWIVATDIGIGIVLGLIALSMAIPATRRLVLGKLLPVIARAFDGVADVIRRPGKVTLLIGGSALVTFSYLTTLYFSTQAFGGGLPFATVGAVFLVGSAVAQAAPTPGGLGAMEAALISGLVAAGMDSTIAVPSVFLYRLFTFWVPILPGWLSFQWLERREYI